jgi:hypothetical protein
MLSPRIFSLLNGTVGDGGDGDGDDDDDDKSNITQHNGEKELSLLVLFIRFSKKTSNLKPCLLQS